MQRACCRARRCGEHDRRAACDRDRARVRAATAAGERTAGLAREHEAVSEVERRLDIERAVALGAVGGEAERAEAGALTAQDREAREVGVACRQCGRQRVQQELIVLRTRARDPGLGHRLQRRRHRQGAGIARQVAAALEREHDVAGHVLGLAVERTTRDPAGHVQVAELDAGEQRGARGQAVRCGQGRRRTDESARARRRERHGAEAVVRCFALALTFASGLHLERRLQGTGLSRQWAT